MKDRLKALADKKIILYGARKFGKIALNNLRTYGLEPVCFVDDNVNMQYKKVDGVEVFPLKEAIQIYEGGGRRIALVISHFYYDTALLKLNQSGIDARYIYFLPWLLVDALEEGLFQECKQEIEEVYHWLGDLKSKKVFGAMINARKNFDISEFAFLRENIQYFPTDIFQYRDEVMVDGGAFTGDTICSLQNVCIGRGGKLEKAYAFEPDEENSYLLSNNKDIKCEVELYKSGMYSENTMLSFSGGEGGSSCVEENGELQIETRTIDSIKFDKLPTLIKMDIEGCELEALRGGEKTIRTYKPKLAICIYHKQSDIWEIPHYIKKIVPEYNLYIRNYTNWLDEIVLYATL